MEQIESLLLSIEQNNIKIALEMIKTDHLIEKYKIELFIAYQFSENAVNKTVIKGLITQLGEENLQKAIDQRYNFNIASEKKITQYIEQIADAANLEKDKFAYAIFLKTKDRKPDDLFDTYKPVRGLDYFLKHQKPAQRKKIIAAYMNGDTFTINSDSKRINLPEEILEFKDLKNISIVAPLTKIPKIISKITALKRLHFSIEEEGLDVLPKEIVTLLALEELDLDNRYLTSLPEKLTALKNLKKMRFSMHAMEAFPKVVTRLNTLESLSVEDVDFENIPTEIINLSDLKYLKLVGQGDAGSLSPLLEKMISLEHFVLHFYNDPNFLPAISKLTNLKKLELSGEFEEFPIEITIIKNLEELQITKGHGTNCFNRVPKEIQRLEKLKKLIIEGYPLDDLPSALSKLPKLTCINISAFEKVNKFTELPNVIKTIPTLEELVISSHQFELFSDELITLKSLKRIGITINSSDHRTILKKAISLMPHCEVFLIDQYVNNIGTFVSKKILSIDAKSIGENTPKKLAIKDQIVNIPDQINTLTGLKELRIQDTIVLNVSPAIFQLKDIFIFFENNSPAYIQEIPLLIFDLQQKKITENQAIVYLHLLQEDHNALSIEYLPDLINALDYRIENVRIKAINYLDTLLRLENNTITEKAVITIIGMCTTFAISTIKKRLKKLAISIELQLSPKTTHLILGTAPDLDQQLLDLTKIQITTERNFKDWLDTVDQQLLNSKTEESSSAIANISEMLLSENEENIQLAIKMMKTHGAGSKELLTSLCIFNNSYKLSLRPGNRTKAKNVFKKNASKELLEFISEDLWMPTYEISFYQSLQKNRLLDPLKIAYYLDKEIYLTLQKDKEKRKEFLNKMIKNNILDLGSISVEKLQEELLEIPGMTGLIIGGSYEMLPEWIGDLTIERLSLEYVHSLDSLPKSFINLQNLKELRLPEMEVFPEILLNIKTLEQLSMEEELFLQLPDEINNLPQLTSITVRDCYDTENIEIRAKTMSERIKINISY